MFRRRWFGPLAGLAALIAACSSTSSTASPDVGRTDASPAVVGDAGALPVDGTRLLGGLTPAEQAALCDWFATMGGGYGAVHTYSCEASTVAFDEKKSQADCIAAYATLLPGCTATIQQAADCLAEQFRDPCGFDVSAICQVYYANDKTCNL